MSENSNDRARASSGGRGSRLGRKSAVADNDNECAPAESPSDPSAPVSGNIPTPETHILVDLLREKDFYHASAAIHGSRQRAKRRVLCAQRFAEISLLHRSGWRVICIAEHQWTHGAAGDLDVAEA